MKPASLIPCVFLAVGLALCACGGNAGNETAKGPSNAPIEVVTDDNGVYLSDYLASEEFDAAAAGIEDESNLPTRLHCYFANSAEGDIYNRDTMLRFWLRLCGVEIDITAPDTETAIDDGDAIFQFIWDDGSTVTFTFCTSEYYEDNGTLYPVVHQALTSSIFKEAHDAIDGVPQQSSANNVVGAESITDVEWGFYWDADGDGSNEYFDISYQDNGDEAPSFLVISLASDGDVAVLIDGAYGIAQLEGSEDADGLPLLVVTYYEGDYYGHDNLATVVIKMEGGELVQVEE